MNTQVEHLDNHTARLTVEVPQERIDKAMQSAARRLANQYTIPGFRKGKAPYNIVLQRFGAEYVLSEALDAIGDSLFKAALDESGITPYAPGELADIKKEPTLTLSFVVPKQPEIELANYRDIRLPFEFSEVEDDKVTEAMEALVERQAVIEPAERAAQMGDVVKAHIHGDVTHPAHEGEHGESEHEHEEHEQPEGEEETTEPEAHGHTDVWMDNEDDVVITENAKRDLLPGFSAHLIGMNKDEEKSFTISFPDDYEDKGLAGHTYDFTVKVQEVKSRTLPVQNDEFAKTASEGKFETLLDLRVDVRRQLNENAKREAENKYADAVLDQIVEQATVKYPEMMVEETIDDMLETFENALKQNGLSLDTYKTITGTTDEKLRGDYREGAIKRLKRNLALGEMVKLEKLTVTDDDLNAEIDRLASSFGEQAGIFRQMLRQPDNARGVALELLTNRAVQRMIAIAKGENPPIEAEPAEEAAPVEQTEGQPEAQQPEQAEATSAEAPQSE